VLSFAYGNPGKAATRVMLNRVQSMKKVLVAFYTWVNPPGCNLNQNDHKQAKQIKASAPAW
jgi:hypothetical protein